MNTTTTLTRLLKSGTTVDLNQAYRLAHRQGDLKQMASILRSLPEWDLRIRRFPGNTLYPGSPSSDLTRIIQGMRTHPLARPDVVMMDPIGWQSFVLTQWDQTHVNIWITSAFDSYRQMLLSTRDNPDSSHIKKIYARQELKSFDRWDDFNHRVGMVLRAADFREKFLDFILTEMGR